VFTAKSAIQETKMRSSLFAILVAGAIALSPQASSGQARFGISGGLAAPVSDLDDVAEPGYNVAAALHFGGTHVPLGARLEGSLNGFSLDENEDNARILNLTLNAVANFGQRPTSPYLIGGLGLYNSKVASLDAQNTLGINVGGGLRFPIGHLTTFVEARYHLMFGDRTDFANFQFIPLTFGVVY
jgi:Outer membrane protein beta-barrel domain